MADIPAIERLLKEIEGTEGVQHALLVGRSGFHIAGRLPEDVNNETFIAMFAILLGAATEAADTLRETLESVVITTASSRVVVVEDGPKALFVLRVMKTADVEKIRARVATFTAKMAELL